MKSGTMHELSICQGLVKEATHVASAQRAARVTRIVVAIGPLSGVEAPLLERAFTVARAGTIAHSAILEIEMIPVRVWCGDCNAETPAAANRLLCGKCGDWKVQLKSGDELILKSVELEKCGDEATDATAYQDGAAAAVPC
jgi:hydrogenase nickel incorporation protein HypA/HybF